MDFSFLNTVTVNKVEEAPKSKSGGRVAQEKNPKEGLTLRLFKDGSIYPSQKLVDKFNLEYTKDKSGNGFDVFSSSNWNQYPKDAENVVFISATSKENARVDLFGQAREVNGELTKVMEQGSKTFGKELIKMLGEVYGTELLSDDIFNGKKYVDLQVIEDITMPSVDNIFYIPKMTNKGEHKGVMTTERRENAILHPLAILSNNNGGGVADKVVEEPELVEEDSVA